MATAKKTPIWTLNFIWLFLTTFCIFIIFYGLFTLLPIYVVNELGGTTAQAGTTITAFLLSAILSRPFSGKIMDIFGKRKVLVACSLLFTTSTILYVFISNYILLIILRFFHGIWFSIITTATGSLAADITPESRRGEGLGYYMLAMNVGMVIGPFVALSLVNEISFKMIFIIFSFLMLIGFVSSLFIKVATTVLKTKKLKLNLNDLFERKAVPISVLGSLISFGYASIVAFISIFAEKLDLIKSASFFFLVVVIAIIITRPIVGPLFDKKGPNVVMIPALLSFSLGLYILSITSTSTLLLMAAFFIGLGYGTLLPCLQAIAVSAAAKGRSGHATATFFTLFDIGLASGSFLLGLIVVHFGYSNLYMYVSVFVLFLLIPYQVIQKRYF